MINLTFSFISFAFLPAFTVSSGGNMLSMFCSTEASRLILLCHWGFALTKASSVFQGNKGQGGVKGEKVRLASTGVQSRRGSSSGWFWAQDRAVEIPGWRFRGRDLRSPLKVLLIWPDIAGPHRYMPRNCRVQGACSLG